MKGLTFLVKKVDPFQGIGQPFSVKCQYALY